MKKLVTIISLFITLHAMATPGESILLHKNAAPCDTTVLPAILSLPLSSYIGKPVDSLLTALPGGYTHRGFMPLRIRHIRGVSQSYGDLENNVVIIEVFIDEFHYLQVPRSANLPPWDMSLAKKEKIAYIKIIKNNKICVYGCDNPNYHY